jgi:hypothetical protein
MNVVFTTRGGELILRNELAYVALFQGNTFSDGPEKTSRIAVYYQFGTDIALRLTWGGVGFEATIALTSTNLSSGVPDPYDLQISSRTAPAWFHVLAENHHTRAKSTGSF